jgi:hypothetical protein
VTTTDPLAQHAAAARLAEVLADSGHEELAPVDLLDALASVGLMLVPDADGVASGAYLHALGQL